jgi:hypothetical protein
MIRELKKRVRLSALKSGRLFAAIGTMIALSILAGCGTDSTVQQSSVAAQSADSEGSTTTTPSPTRSLMGDEDDEDTEEGTRPHGDVTTGDSDHDFDHDLPKQGGYYDSDDAPIRSFGSAARGTQKRELTFLAQRYFAAASAGDGSAGCSLFTSYFVKAVPEDYGHGSAGPSYLSAGRTCAAVLTPLFKHMHVELAAPIKVTAVRVKGGEALVLIGSHVMPASALTAHREAGGWRLVGLLGLPLP